jgi:hypothetical protein
MKMQKLILGALIMVGCGDPSALSQVNQITTIGQGQQKVYVQNESGWAEADLHFYASNQNIQLQRDFGPQWGIDAVVILAPPPNPNTDLQLTFIPDFTRFDPKLKLANVHGARFKNRAYVNFSITGPEGSTSPTGSHETIEMLVNPTDDPHGFQACDPVAPYAYGVGPGIDPVLGQNMSDFVYPPYFVRGSLGPWDHMRLITRQGVPAPGGFNFNDQVY